MGNIQSLTRNGFQDNGVFTNMDVLDYDYDAGNKLTKVTDTGNATHGFKDGNTSGDDYSYDENGNLEIDKNKSITGITYNHLNLPTEVVFDNNPNKKITYLYDADGVKQKKTVVNGSSLTVTEYGINHIYENDELQFFNHAEGYVSVENNNSYSYVYSCLDHLGNVRLSYTDANGDGQVDSSEIIEESNYYPFGLKQRGYNNNVSALGNSTAQKWKFSSKELNEELGLNWYDISARNYQADLGRWMNVDPLAEDYYEWSPYNYSYNSPLKFNDPTGLGPEDVIFLIDREGAGGKGHLAMLYQDGNGDWYYFSQGATGDAGTGALISGSNTDGGVTNVKLEVTETVAVKDKNGKPVIDKNGKPVTQQVTRSATEQEALQAAKSGSFGYQFDDSVKIETTKQEDKNITKAAAEVEANHKSGKSKYNLFRNNCVDACQDAVQNNTNIDLPTDYSPVPNSYFNKLKKNQKKINKTKKTRNN